jgi:carbohydrate-selective porin OprB
LPCAHWRFVPPSHRCRRRQPAPARVSLPVRRQAINRLLGRATRGTETFIEITYQCQVTPWWQLQPDFQYVFVPGGGLQNQSSLPKRISNEAVLGLRTTITF